MNMVKCLYNDVQDLECTWNGEDSELVDHLTGEHGVFLYTVTDQDRIVLELGLDTEYSGYRYVILEFLKKNGKRTVVIFEEVFDDSCNVFKLGVRSVNTTATMYKILLQGSNSSMWYCGLTMGLEKKKDFSGHHQCLEVHKAQLNKFCYTSQNELTYKLIVSLTN